MKTIIAPTDLSEVSYNACLYAAKMAKDLQANLLLLHVMELPISVAEFPVAEEVFDEISMEEELELLKNKLVEETNGKVDIKTENIPGSVEYEVKELCNYKKPFAVVMATHKYNAVARFLFGSTTVYAVRNLNYPVLVVPAGVTYKPIKKVALATDLKNIFELPVTEIETILAALGASIEVLYVGKTGRAINKRSVESLLLSHRLLNTEPAFFAIEDEDLEHGVAELARAHNIDLLLIIPKKHGPFHKSKTKEFVFYSPVPVLAIHENDVVQQS